MGYLLDGSASLMRLNTLHIRASMHTIHLCVHPPNHPTCVGQQQRRLGLGYASFSDPTAQPFYARIQIREHSSDGPPV